MSLCPSWLCGLHSSQQPKNQRMNGKGGGRVEGGRGGDLTDIFIG